VRRALNLTHSTLFRTYKIDGSNEYAETVTIWQAARATSAAPTFFKRIHIGPEGAEEEFLDGGLGSNNPVSKLIEEAEEAFPDLKRKFPNLKPRFDCILSIGTGKRPIGNLKKPDTFQKILPTALIKALASMATDTEETAERVLKQFEAAEGGPNVYFRFNVEHGMQDITLAEWERLGEITAHTKSYLDGREVRRKVEGAVAALSMGHGAAISYVPPQSAGM
jgi:patatin-like phospholipase/acyl hydrolase